MAKEIISLCFLPPEILVKLKYDLAKRRRRKNRGSVFFWYFILPCKAVSQFLDFNIPSTAVSREQ